MRVIVVDSDSAMLDTVVRALRTQFAIDSVSTKADCIDLLRQNDFDVVVACERLEDGSGLELLGQVAKRWPATLRVFAADRERLQLLQGRLGPFELFQTLAYPINPQKLLSTLLLARGAHEADADTTTIQHIVLGDDDPTQTPAPTPREPEPPLKRAAAPPARPERPTARAPARALTPPRPPTPPLLAPSRQSLPSRASPAFTAETAAPAAARAQVPTRPQAPPPARPKTPVYFGRSAEDAAPVIDSLAAAAEVAAAATRMRAEPQDEGMPASRKAFIAGAGCAVVLCAVGLAVLQLRPSHQASPVLAASLPPQPHFSREVTDLVAAVELDLEQDDFKKAEVDTRKLQTLAPDHPRLQFFLTLLDHNNRPHGGSVSRVAAVAATTAPKPTLQRKTAPALADAARIRDSRPVPTAASAPRGSFAGSAEPANAVTAPPANVALQTGAVAETSGAQPPAVADATATTPALTANFSGRQLDDAPPAASATPGSASVARAPADSSTQPSAQVTRTSAPANGIPVVTADAQLTRRVPPDYPVAAIRKGIEGYVDLHFTITPKGTVANVAVVKAEPAEVFDNAATEAVRRWRYDPRTVDGQPVESESQVHLQFKLEARSSLSH